MKDYHDLWERWISFLNGDLTFRKEILDALNIEVTKGFDVVVRVCGEELPHSLSDTTILPRAQQSLQTSLAMCTLAGYILFLLEHDIDPRSANLIARTSTNSLGNLWIAAYEKDHHQSYLLNIDPILSMFLEKMQQNEMNLLMVEQPFLKDISFKDATQLITFLNWAGHQGYILGTLESELFQKGEDNGGK